MRWGGTDMDFALQEPEGVVGGWTGHGIAKCN